MTGNRVLDALSMILKLYFGYILQNYFGPAQDLFSLTLPARACILPIKGLHVFVCWEEQK